MCRVVVVVVFVGVGVFLCFVCDLCVCACVYLYLELGGEKRVRNLKREMEMTITPLPNSRIGAVVKGINSAAALARMLDKGGVESERIAARLADALRDHLLLLLRGEDGEEDEANAETMSPSEMRSLYMHIHAARFPELRVAPPEASRPGWSEDNIRGATFPGFNETQVLGYAEHIDSWHGLSGPLKPTAWWVRSAGQFHHDGGFSSTSRIPPALVSMHCEESPTAMLAPQVLTHKHHMKCAAGATLFFPTSLSLVSDTMAARARKMRCVYVESFGRVVFGTYPQMKNSFLIPEAQSPVIDMRGVEGKSANTGYRSNTDIPADEYADRQKRFESAASPAGEKEQETAPVFYHRLVQQRRQQQQEQHGTDCKNDEYVVCHCVCLDHLEEETENGEWHELSWEASMQFMEELLLPMSMPPNLCALNWRRGDYMLFDNLRTQHSVSASDLYSVPGCRRLMTRTACQPSGEAAEMLLV